MSIVLEALSVNVNMSFDPRGFFQNTDQTDKFSAIAYDLANAGRDCPVCRMLSKEKALKSKVLVH